MLIRYARNKYSQWGEDGIIEQLFSIIGCDYRSCIEVGAGDGIINSNTRLLYENGWRSLQIEEDGGLYEALVRNTSGYPNVNTLHSKVSKSNFNDIIKEFEFTDCDFLVIDIDGDDYYLWDSVTAIEPAVVMIEFNHTFQFNVEFIQKEGSRIGSSSYALRNLARRKGYHLVAMTETNCVFLHNDVYNIHKSEFSSSYAALYFAGLILVNHYPRDYDNNIYCSGVWDFSGKVLQPAQLLNQMAIVHQAHTEPLEIEDMLQSCQI